MSDDTDENPGERRFDLAERTAVYGERVIAFCRQIKLDAITSPLVTQLVKAATSVGGNYDEADEAVSKRDFRYRIGICKKEARESKRWLRMIAAATPDRRDDARTLWQEGHERHMIFASIYRNTDDTG